MSDDAQTATVSMHVSNCGGENFNGAYERVGDYHFRKISGCTANRETITRVHTKDGWKWGCKVDGKGCYYSAPLTGPDPPPSGWVHHHDAR